MNLVKRRLFYFILSGLVLVVGLASLVAPSGLKLGIEFTSGSTLTLKPQEGGERITEVRLREELAALGYSEVVIQGLEGGDFFVRLPEINVEEEARLEKALVEDIGLTVQDFAAVSPVIAKEIGRDAAVAVIVACIAMLLYIAWAFRHMPKPFRWGACAIGALVHDVLVVVGIFSVLGRLFNIQIDALFITALLALVGYSINNTVVVFDRLRENLTLEGSRNLQQVFNRSVIETLSRNLNTSLTTLFTLLALLLFGGATIHNFILAFTIGLVAGAYNSIFIAPMLLLTWEKGWR